MNWKEKAVDSHVLTAVAIQDELRAGHVEQAAEGIQELIEALTRSDRRALKSQLVRLMVHVLKWQTQPERRGRSWAATIRGARKEIRDLQTDTPSLTDDVIRAMWNNAFELAKDQAESETNQEVSTNALSWEEVFTSEYRA